MNNGDRIRRMNNAELAEEIWNWHDELFGTRFRFIEDIKDYLDQEAKPTNIMEAAMDELFS